MQEAHPASRIPHPASAFYRFPRTAYRLSLSPMKGSDRLRRLASFALVAALAVAAASCNEAHPNSTLTPHSDFGREIDFLWDRLLLLGTIVFVLVEGALLYVVIRYRRRDNQVTPPQTHGNTKLEIAWTLIPAVILVFIAVPTVKTIFITQAQAAPGSLNIDVTGHQWWWEFRYQELGLVAANELHVPLGRAVQLSITSADVIHSFWIPPLGGKRDAIPGHVTRIAFRPDQVGEYVGQCAEFCGASHANMRLRVVVDTDTGFGRWATVQLAGPAAPAPGTLAERGKAVFARSACIGCHTIQGVSPGVIGPNLTHVGGRATIASGLFPNDSAHLARWIADAPSLKPGSLMTRMQPPLTDADIAALVAYLESLK